MPERKYLYEFGPFRLDPVERLLLRDQTPIPLTPKAFDTLLLLIENSGHLLKKDELLQRLWPGTFVEEVNLAQNISAIRRVLDGKGTGEQYIETVPKVGYRFLAAVRALPTPASPSQPSPTVRPTGNWRTAVIVTVAVIGLSVAAALPWRSHGSRQLTERDTIVLVDFVNNTGDSVFDDTLKQGLRAHLEQSPFLNIISDEKIGEELRLMGRSSEQRLTRDVARDLCQRIASKAVLQGSITNLGSHYVIGLDAVTCAGDMLDSEQAEADSREHVLRVLGESASKLRQKLGESLSTIQRYDAPLEEATTPSLAALQAYSLAMKTWRAKSGADALPFFDHAIQSDPRFALAYAKLADVYEDLGEAGLAGEYAAKAYPLRDRVTEREKYGISVAYYFHQTGELPKVLETAQLWAQVYPRDSLAHQYQSVVHEFLGQYREAIAEGLQALRLDPDGPNLYSNLMEDYLALNQLEDARAMYQRAVERKLDNAFLHDDMYVLAFLKRDSAEMARQVSWSIGKFGAEDLLLSAQADTEAFSGHAAAVRRLSRKAAQVAFNNHQKETAALWILAGALQEAEFGDRSHARQNIEESLNLAPTRNVQMLAALALARAGDLTRAQKLGIQLEEQLPSNTELINYWLPCARAAIELNLSRPDRALSLLERTKPYEFAFPRPQIGGGGPLYPVWLRGLALLADGRGAAAAAEFRKILEFGNIVANSPIHALAHLQLARAYALQSEVVQARAAYADFLTLWKDADPDIPILKQAKTEYAKLQ
jgi:DNA-binding winged helix-turn-helix (wHTH) protein/tetratricopeptide (TPR) repeat protein